MLSACGHAGRSTPQPARTPAPAAPAGPAFGLTEDNADLLWNPGAGAPAQAGAFTLARRELTALHPQYLRLLIDWAALQPSPQRPPALEATVSGCARDVAPCGAFAGVAGELAAIASQQRAARVAGQDGFQVVIDILGAPAWAALPPHGCERAGTSVEARALSPDAIPAYESLIGDLLALAAK
ncbi:MAG: hypothetical protein ACLQBB_02125, partial [Solirubrobacteraceae bacterium]